MLGKTFSISLYLLINSVQISLVLCRISGDIQANMQKNDEKVLDILFQARRQNPF